MQADPIRIQAARRGGGTGSSLARHRSAELGFPGEIVTISDLSMANQILIGRNLAQRSRARAWKTRSFLKRKYAQLVSPKADRPEVALARLAARHFLRGFAPSRASLPPIAPSGAILLAPALLAQVAAGISNPLRPRANDFPHSAARNPTPAQGSMT